MKKEKNTYKKSDANGCELKEEIGNGLNENHPYVIKHREYVKNMKSKTKEAVKTLKAATELIKDWKDVGGSDSDIRDFMMSEIVKKKK